MKKNWSSAKSWERHAEIMQVRALRWLSTNESQSVKIRATHDEANVGTVFVELNEVIRERQRHVSASKYLGLTTTAKRNFAAGHRVIQIRWSLRECIGSVKSKKKCVKSKMVLRESTWKTNAQRFSQQSHRLSLQATLARCQNKRSRHHDSDYTKITTDVQTALQQADIGRDVLGELPCEAE